MKVILTGGGTGGHIFPLVSVARELNIESGDRIEFLYVGPKDLFSMEAFAKEDIPVKLILAGKIRRYFSFSSFFYNIFDILINTPLGFIQSFFTLVRFKPDFIFSKGGYGSVPVVLMARLLNIPIFLHESDSIPGLANKFIGFFANKIFTSFPQWSTDFFPQEKVILSGNPIRGSILKGESSKGKTIFELRGASPILLVLGGSQGSRRINDLIIDNLDYLLEKFEIIHQTGKIDYDRIIDKRERIYKKEYFHVYDFFNEEMMANALACADCIISRSGSGSISEIAAVSKPAILIPLPEAAQNHQVVNALVYEKETKACVVISEEDLSKDRLFSSLVEISNILKEDILQSTVNFSRIGASNIIAKKILEEVNSSINGSFKNKK